MNATTIAVDLAKTVFELVIADEQGRLVERKRLSREGFARLFANRPPCRIVMEACATAHHWARTFQAQGHEVKLLPPQHVRPYVRRNKTDRTDAAALLEADRCGDLLPVPVKTVEQQGLQGLHRVRSAWMATRTDRINATRGLLREFGLDLPQGPAAVLAQVPTWLGGRGEPDPARPAGGPDRTDRGNPHPRHPHRRPREPTPRAGPTTAGGATADEGARHRPADRDRLVSRPSAAWRPFATGTTSPLG